MNYQYDDGGRAEAGFKGKAGDCVTRAIVIASQLPYRQVYDALATGNASERRTRHSRNSSGKRTARNGINIRRKWFREYMQSLGFVWTPTMKVGQGCKVHLRAEELPIGRLVVQVSTHFTAVIDGIVHDTFEQDRDGTRCVYGYWSLAQEEGKA